MAEDILAKRTTDTDTQISKAKSECCANDHQEAARPASRGLYDVNK